MKIAALELTKRALAVARQCAQKLPSLSLKTLKQAQETVESAKYTQDFSNNASKELQFTLRQLSGIMRCTLNFKTYVSSESVFHEKIEREKRANQEEEDKYKVVSYSKVILFDYENCWFTDIQKSWRPDKADNRSSQGSATQVSSKICRCQERVSKGSGAST